MNKNRIKAVILCFAMMFSLFGGINIYATDCTMTQTGVAEVTVTLVPKTDVLSVSVYPLGKTYNDIYATEEENYNHIMVYGNEFSVTGGQEFEFVMDLSHCHAGTYVMTVSDNGDIYRKRIDFERNDWKQIASGMINGATSVDVVIDTIDEYYREIGIYEDDYNNADIETVAGYIYNSVKDGAVFADNVATKNMVNRAIVMGLIANESIEDIYGRIDAFELSNTDLEGWYNAEFVTDAMKLNITKRLKDFDVSQPEKFVDSFREAYILSVIANSDTYSKVKKVIENYNSFIGAGKGLNVKDYGYIVGVDFENKTKLKEKIDELLANPSEGGSSGNGGGGGGGGSSSKNDSGMTNPLPGNVPSEPSEKLEVDIFADIKGVEWARNSIVALAEKGVISGKGGMMFCPYDNVTRYEFAKIAVLAFMPETSVGEIAFTDVSADHWAYEYVKKAYGAGLIKGRDEYTFDGNGLITREEMATILLRAAQASGISVSTFEDAKSYTFRDDASISGFAKEAIYILKYDNIINGVGDDYFAPSKNATRAEAAHMVYALTQL